MDVTTQKVYFIVVCLWKYVRDLETAGRLRLQACDQALSVSGESPVTIVTNTGRGTGRSGISRTRGGRIQTHSNEFACYFSPFVA